jgi:hypothetical protein
MESVYYSIVVLNNCYMQLLNDALIPIYYLVLLKLNFYIVGMPSCINDDYS